MDRKLHIPTLKGCWKRGCRALCSNEEFKNVPDERQTSCRCVYRLSRRCVCRTTLLVEELEMSWWVKRYAADEPWFGGLVCYRVHDGIFLPRWVVANGKNWGRQLVAP
jgi:hypothetical protein